MIFSAKENSLLQVRGLLFVLCPWAETPAKMGDAFSVINTSSSSSSTCISPAEPPPEGLAGRYRTDTGTRELIIDESGTISYSKPALEITGMGMSGWTSDEGAVGNILCISHRLKIEKIDEEYRRIRVNGAVFSRR